VAFDPDSIKTMRSHQESVSESIIVPATLDATWSVADNPRKLAPSVPMLGRFDGPESLREGAPLAEVHTILGWSQHFRGTVTAFAPRKRWAMTSAPVESGPASLPHDVEYAFEGTPAGTCVTIRCDYARGGLLRLPFGRIIVRMLMSYTLRQLLNLISKNAQELQNRRTAFAHA